MDDSELTCSFCDKPSSEVRKMIAGEKANICDECLEICINAKDEEQTETEEQSIPLPTPPSPLEMKEYLDQYIIGQDDAKITVCVAVANHYKRLRHISDDVQIEKSNILLIGPSASGKTKIANTIANFLNVPFAIADATTLTEAGYVGEDVESILSRLLYSADMDVSRAETGIIFIDEIDKIRRKGASAQRDISGEGVQQALLKLLEGYDAMVPVRRGSMEFVRMDTRNILFICSGAFVGLNEIANSKTKIGFKSDDKSPTKSVLTTVEPEHLETFGMIPEILGRLPVIATLQELDEDQLVRVLTEPKNSIVRQFQKIFEIDGVKLKFDQESLRAIAKEAMKHKTGARGLRGILERALLNLQYNLPQIAKSGVKQIEIDENVILRASQPRMKKRASKVLVGQ